MEECQIKRARVLIICNTDFGKAGYRDGAENDYKKGIEVLIDKFGYDHFLEQVVSDRKRFSVENVDMTKIIGDETDKDYISHESWTKNQMIALIKSFAMSEYDGDGLILIISSHGNVDHNGDTFVVGRDNQVVLVKDILSYMSDTNCHASVVGKPKILFMQACRGSHTDPCNIINIASGDTCTGGHHDNSTAHMHRMSEDESDDATVTENARGFSALSLRMPGVTENLYQPDLPTNATSSSPPPLEPFNHLECPNQCIVVYSSPVGQKASRQPSSSMFSFNDEGSMMICSVLEHLNKKGNPKALLPLLIAVTNELSQEKSNDHRNIPVIEHRLTILPVLYKKMNIYEEDI